MKLNDFELASVCFFINLNSLTNRAFQITNLRFDYKSRISFYKCDFSDYN